MKKNNNLPYLIAEVGGNHAGNFQLAKQSIINAKKSGADCIKYQWYSAKSIVHPKMKVMKHVRKKSKEKTQFERFKNLELSHDQIKELYFLSKKHKIDFCVTPFDVSYVKFLSKYVNFFKIASGDLDFIPLLKEINKYRKPVFISTGLSNHKKIQNALKLLKNCQVTILHCISSYPTPIEQANLKNILNLKNKYKNEIGLSDHTIGNISALVAIGMGVRIIEKHFLPNSKIKNVGDFDLSLNPEQFKKFRLEINDAYLSLGNSRNDLYKSEINFKQTLKRSIYYNKNLKKGDKINENDIICLRPFNENGIKIELYNKIINNKIKRNVRKFELIKPSDLN